MTEKAGMTSGLVIGHGGTLPQQLADDQLTKEKEPVKRTGPLAEE